MSAARKISKRILSKIQKEVQEEITVKYQLLKSRILRIGRFWNPLKCFQKPCIKSTEDKFQPATNKKTIVDDSSSSSSKITNFEHTFVGSKSSEDLIEQELESEII